MADAVQEPEGGIDNTLAAAFAQVRQQMAAAEAEDVERDRRRRRGPRKRRPPGTRSPRSRQPSPPTRPTSSRPRPRSSPRSTMPPPPTRPTRRRPQAAAEDVVEIRRRGRGCRGGGRVRRRSPRSCETVAADEAPRRPPPPRPIRRDRPRDDGGEHEGLTAPGSRPASAPDDPPDSPGGSSDSTGWVRASVRAGRRTDRHEGRRGTVARQGQGASMAEASPRTLVEGTGVRLDGSF